MSRTLSKYNNTNVNLASNAVFTGINERVSNYDAIIIMKYFLD